MQVDGLDRCFWRNKRVLLTGHTGFKGSWASLWLSQLGADVTGLSLSPEAEPNLYTLASISRDVRSHIVDLRDRQAVNQCVLAADPEIVLHMAAQPLVRRSYVEPVENFSTNIMGTIHLLDALRACKNLDTVLVVTTDKVYENTEKGNAFVEDDPLGGHDPYAASKAATEIVVSSYARSFFAERGVKLATARGGNVIGGGDFSEDRIIPDIWRAARAGVPLVLRSPNAARPWQHVLDCLSGYFAYTRGLSEGLVIVTSLNFGPSADAEQMRVADLAEAVQAALGVGDAWELATTSGPHEMSALSIDSSRARALLGWRDRLAGPRCVEWLAAWYRALNCHENMREFTLSQILQYGTLGEHEIGKSGI